MPRVDLNKEKYMRKDTENMIRNKMRGNVTQEELGKEFGITQAAVSKKIKECDFDYKQLVFVFKRLDFTDEEILKCMRG